jgi:IS5 family transposase
VSGSKLASGTSCTKCCSNGAAPQLTPLACRRQKGAATGANPTDRGKSGTKRHLVVEAQGIRLAVGTSAAHVPDARMMLECIDAIEPLKRLRGRPRRRSDRLHADKAYDSQALRVELRRCGIQPRVARRGCDSSERLGRYRWVVERTGAWLNRFRPLRIRYEQRAEIHQAFFDLSCALICWNFIQQRF